MAGARRETQGPRGARCQPLAKTLKRNGCNTARFGECHEVPV